MKNTLCLPKPNCEPPSDAQTEDFLGGKTSERPGGCCPQ